jgi:hypothetical protein
VIRHAGRPQCVFIADPCNKVRPRTKSRCSPARAAGSTSRSPARSPGPSGRASCVRPRHPGPPASTRGPDS